MTILCKKYETKDGRIVNRTTGKPIPEGEPLIVFRAKDRHLPWLLDEYAARCIDDNHKLVILDRREDVIRWQRDHRESVKEPDTGPLPSDG